MIDKCSDNIRFVTSFKNYFFVELQSADFISSLPPLRPELYQCLELPRDPTETLGIL